MTLSEAEVIRYEESFNNYLDKVLEEIETNDILKNEDIEKCMELSRSEEDEIALRVLVNTFSRINGNLEFTKLKYKVIMGGFLVAFNINKITNKQFEQYQDSNKIRIFGCKKGDIEKYWLELSFRRRVMEIIINDQYDTGIQGEHYDKDYDEE